MTRLRRRASERGAVIVEMAFIAPMLMLFLIGSLQVGLVVIGNSTASNGAREGARAASIRYECADNHISARCPTNPSPNYTFIRNAVMSRLAGLVKTDSVTVTVECRDRGAAGTVILCEKGYADLDSDVIVVSVGWRHIGATPYIADNVHTSVARSGILGQPDLASPSADVTPPSLLSAEVYDVNLDGVLDQIKLTFSEDIVQTVNKDRLSINNSVTGSTNIASATVVNRVVTISLSGGTTVDTAPGSMGISLSASVDGIRDLAGNQASFSSTPLTDLAAPRLIGLADNPGALNGYPNALDTLTLSFTEPIATSLGSTTVAYRDPSSPGSDTIQIAGITAGALTTNSITYNVNSNSTVSVSALVSKSGNNVTVTILSPLLCSPVACTGLGPAVSDSPDWTFTPATTLVDAAGNAAGGTLTISNLF